jgi:TRAP-type uncharacterized transport system substrate-binding protein
LGEYNGLASALCKRSVLLFFVSTLALRAQETPANRQVGKTIDVGHTGFAAKKPVFASACPHGCPWGELGEFMQAALRDRGYEIVLCRNCNRAEGPRLVSKASFPPALTASDLLVGTDERVNAHVDFGVTASGFLAEAYEGRDNYAHDGPYRNLRLIAKIEDPTYLLIAVKKESSITDLAQIRDKQLPVRMLVSLSSGTLPLLDYYGLTRDAVERWGGSFANAMLSRGDEQFDVIISDLASPANNPESSYWTRLSQKYDLRFLDLPEALLAKLAANDRAELIRVTAQWGLLRGVDRPIATVGRSGESIFGRDDMPARDAYVIAKAIDDSRGALQWYIRPYSYNPSTVWRNANVPLHPGAERYYREKGYLKK